MITYIEIKRFKSINELSIDLKPINILIGSNGVGKSNFISFFKLVGAIFNRNLQRYIMDEKVDNILYFGMKRSESLYGKMIFDSEKGNNNAYFFELVVDKYGGMFISKEGSGFNVNKDDDNHNYFRDLNLLESKIPTSTAFRDNFLRFHLKHLQIFHFHDTSSTSFLRRASDINDNLFLRQDGRNLPAFLYFLKEKHKKIYSRIVKTIQSVAPYIHDFILEPKLLNHDEIEIRWVDSGDLESSFSAYQLSDGTLRFIALATLLMQPNPPSVIIIDEPELGLHPFAIGKLAGLIKLAATKSQIILATQSPGMVSHFKPDDIIVMNKNKEQNQTTFGRLDPEELKPWLEEYSLGELWQRNNFDSAQPFIK